MATARPVSSFYGYSNQQDGQPNNRDSYLGTASNRGSVMMGNFPPGAAPSSRQSGYYSEAGGRTSYYQDQHQDHQHQQQQQPQEEARPDLYADFNGIGPRYAARLSSSADMYANELNYSPHGADTQTSLLEKGDMSKRQSMAAGEMLLAPELGKDWTGDESRKSRVIVEKPGFGHKSQTAMASFRKRVRKAFAWKRFIFVFFGFLICLAIVLYFVVPRVPSFQLSADEPLTSPNNDGNFTRTPTYMAFSSQLNVAVDARSNWIPIRFSSLEVNVYELDSYKQVGEGRVHGGRNSFPGREITPTSLDIDFEYRGKNVSDTAWLNFYQACAHKYNGTKRPGLNLIIELKMKIAGMIGTKGTATTLTGVECPIELPSSNA